MWRSSSAAKMQKSFIFLREISVSYTHLDVYKRQLRCLAEDVISIFDYLTHPLFQIIRLFENFQRPVSYTHLDVYKRQPPYLAISFKTVELRYEYSSLVTRNMVSTFGLTIRFVCAI